MTMQIFDCEQGSDEWFRCRLGIPTASEFKSVLAKGEGKTRRSYMMKLLGERFTGEPAEGFTNIHMQRGREMEAEARRFYVSMTDAAVGRIGFLRNGSTGCSPDSLVGCDGMLEIKTRLPHLQLELLLDDKVPSEYVAQIQGQLWVAEREWCDLIVYWPKLRPFIKRVKRDEPYISALAAEVRQFNADLDALTERLVREGVVLVSQAEQMSLSHAHFRSDASLWRNDAFGACNE